MEKRNDAITSGNPALSEAITNLRELEIHDSPTYHDEVFFGTILSTFVHRRRFTYEPE